MFQMPITPRATTTGDRLFASSARPAQFPVAMDLCSQSVPAPRECDASRYAAEAVKSASCQAFRPAFTADDWRTFQSFCITRRLPADFRVVVPGNADRTLRFVVEGSLWQEAPHGAAADSKALLPGAMLGADGLFSDMPDDLDVRTLEDSLVLELSYSRQKELTAACPAIAFELLRAAGAAIAARGRAQLAN